MDNQVSSIQSGFQYYPAIGSYLPDYDNIDMASYCSYPGAMGMNGSIFNPMMGGAGCMPFTPMFGMGMNGGSYVDNMKNYQKNWTDYYVETQKMQRNGDLRANGAMEVVEETAANLKDKISRNEQDQVQAAYQKYLEAVKNAYGEASEEEVNSRALALYAQLNGGTSLIQDLRNSGHSSFIQGIIQALSCSTYGRKSAEDNIAEITHQEVPMGEKAEQNVGRVAGAGVAGAGIFAALKAITKSSKKAGIAGLIVAGLVGTATFLTGKAST